MVRSLRRGATTALAAAVLLVPSLAAAQSGSSSSNSSSSNSNTTGTNTTGTNTTGTNTTGTGQPTAPNTSSTTARTLAQLQREARRLTLIARLPAADRQQAGQLLDRADALRLRGSDLRRQELQAYVDALRAGAAPADARAQAQQKIAGARTSLTQDEATLRSDAQAFLQKVPQARALLRFLDAGRGARPQALGRGFGTAPGWRLRPGMGRMGPGMGRQGMMGRDWTGRNWTGRDWTGRDWTGRDWTRPNGNAPGQRPGLSPHNGAPPATPPATPPTGSGNGGSGNGGT